jgi:hypothetical protein
VRDTALPLKNPGALELDLLGGEALEQTAQKTAAQRPALTHGPGSNRLG